MPLFIAFLGAVIVPLIPALVRGIVSYAAVAVGFSLVAYTGISAGIDMIVGYVQANFDGLGRDVSYVVALSGFDKAINAVITCLVFSLTLKGLMSATGYRPRWRTPS
ncbi:hypothetical protein DI392_08170 [Vibrio albus]|uniref:DUF2523 domain-containing protein n=1 Tax=Vibrio albus TaxID=2200953 RepID=A0A2U3BBJ8_9VIBR|nr:DUF2523 family protein [Vibrio albus]PWI34153.1 hypothetical protein DI392_08170 [Vibrio albus]